jgi:hypothetical protein
MHLSDYMTLKNLDDDTVAAAIKRSRVTVSRIRRRKVRPDWETIAELETFSKGQVTANDFAQLEAAE